MVALRNPKINFTPEEYLLLERAADRKSEYFDDQIYAMAGGSPNHSAIQFNLAGEIGPQLRNTSCRGFSNDLKVRTSEQGLFAYPDLTVVCGEPQYHDDTQDVLTNPAALFEVLSPSTEAVDRGAKWVKYRTIQTLRYYVLIAQDTPSLEVYTRQPDGSWSTATVSGLTSTLPLPAIGVTLSLADLYERVVFAPSLVLTTDAEI